MLGGADNPNGELPSYITGADTKGWKFWPAGYRTTWIVSLRYASTTRRWGRIPPRFCPASSTPLRFWTGGHEPDIPVQRREPASCDR